MSTKTTLQKVASLATGLLITLEWGAFALASQQASPTVARDNQSPQLSTGSIHGRVIDVNTEAPITRALVQVGGSAIEGPAGREVPIVATDDQGRYEFNGLAPGPYTLTASKSGYVTLTYGQRRPGEAGRPIQVIAGQTAKGTDFALPRGGSIVARITDDLGDPVAGVYVRTLQRRFRDGHTQLVPAPTIIGVPTNSAGEVLFHALQPGDYYVIAGSSNFTDAFGSAGNERVYVPTYYPGTANSSGAQRVTIGLGGRANVDFSLVATRPARLSGTIRMSDGAVPSEASASLNNPNTSPRGRTITLRPDGTFLLSNVLPGEYSIDVAARPAVGGGQEFASVAVQVNEADVSGIAVTTGTGGIARGRILFDTGSPPSDVRPGSLSVFGVAPVRRAEGVAVRPPPRDDWNFEISALFGPVVFRINPAPAAALVSGPAAAGVSGWYVRAVMLEGKDITDAPVDFSGGRTVEGLGVILTRARTTLTGTAVDSTGNVVSDFAAVLFPQNREEWTPQSSRIAASRPDQQGRFTIVGLPAGNYFAVAVEYLEPGSERDPDLLTQFMDKATRVTVAEGESNSIRLTRVAY
jgi:protocatechuate 3,4-dioxygenase beta subunit